MSDPRAKFQDLLKKLFQFDCAELDFGIYRIMNHKRAAIERFIEKDLLEAVDMDLSTGALAQESGLVQQLAEVAEQIRENFGAEALDAEGSLAEAYQQTPRGKQYLELSERAAAAKSRPQREAEVFNHLYTFFSRYYDEGDFMSLRRYSRRDKYAIPYNGEEVHLHWANNDQYYIKTGENFTNYSYKHGGWTVSFVLRNADVERNNVKGTKRLFLPLAANVELDEEGRTLKIPFEYRPLTAEEEKTFGKGKAQENILAAAEPEIVKAAKKKPEALAALLHEKRKDSDGNPVGLLAHHIRTYTRKNTTDFFIHKDLKGFLERELDFYLKNEVLSIDDLEAGGEARAEGWFQLLRSIKAIGRQIIAFVAQIEEFQKKLFEKKKFVTKVNYCVTLDRVPEELYPVIVENQAQIEEWKRLFHIQEIRAEKLGEVDYSEPLTVEFLVANRFLVLDTAFFGPKFQNELLESLEDLDKEISGILLHGENFHGLKILEKRYSGLIDSIYIDPPYNTDAEPIIYKNDYKSSSWATLIENRLSISKSFLRRNGNICITIDDFQQKELGYISEKIFGKENSVGTIVIRSNPSGRPTPSGLAQSHEYALFFKNSDNSSFGKLRRTDKQIKRYKEVDEDGKYMWELFRKRGSESERKDRRTLFYPIYASESGLRVPKMEWDKQQEIWIILEKSKQGEKELWPIDEDGVERRWRGSWKSIEKRPSNYKIRGNGSGFVNVYYKYRPDQEGVVSTTNWIDAKYSATEHGTGILKDMFPDYKIFDYPKSIYAVEDCVWITGMYNDSGLCLDFFAGSGTTAHAIINLNRNDGGDRKYILLEMGNHFDAVTKPRVLKSVYSDSWSEGCPVSRNGLSQIIKYFRIESYEDALNNITFQPSDAQTSLQFDDYILSYMLNFETKESDTLLNVAKLDSPFDYTLRRHGRDEPLPVDLPETFNFLIGLHVATRRVYDNNGVEYLVYRGKVEGRQTVVIWRTTRGWGEKEFEADRQFVLAQKLTEGAEDVLVNTDSFIPGARSLDPVFKRRMFNGE